MDVIGSATLVWRAGADDPVHAALRAAVCVPQQSYLWVPADAITFVPALLPTIYGDGRALFTLGTLNQRPRYWIVRGDSRWTVSSDSFLEDDYPEPVEFGGLIDAIFEDLEEHFGRARCGYCGQGLSMYGPDDLPECGYGESCDAKGALETGCDWPAVDDQGGCHWSRKRWPALAGLAFAPHPFTWSANLLAEPAA